MITTGSVYDKNLSDEGHRVLVMRRWPRGVSKDAIDEWLPNAGPSTTLLAAYRSTCACDDLKTWKYFADRYSTEIRSRPATLAQLKRFERKHGHIVLLCWEKEPDRCHRKILKDILDKMEE